MTQPAATVQINGPKMDRTVPAPIQSILPDRDWGEFCDKVEEIAKPQGMRLGIGIAIMFGGFILGGFLSGTGHVNGNIALQAIGFPMLFGSVAFGFYNMCKMQNDFNSGINGACEEFSKNHPSLTIHYRTRTYGSHDNRHTDHCFEVFTTGDAIASATTSTPEAPEAVILEAVAVEVPSGSADQSYSKDVKSETSPAFRMKQLEEMRDGFLITEKEYEAKRKEILDSV